MGQTAPDR